MFKLPAWYRIYNIITFLSIPIYLARMVIRSFANPNYRYRFSERLATKTPKLQQEGGVLLHAVSLGEANAAKLFCNLLLESDKVPEVFFSTTTPTGSALVKSNFPSVQHGYLPFDNPILVGRFLDSLKPSVLVIMETELWPGLLFESKRRGIKIIIINARISDRSFKGYNRFMVFTQDMVKAIDLVLAQSELDKNRFIELGVERKKSKNIGNVKFDLEFKESDIIKGTNIKNDFADRVIFIAASTHPREEEIILDAFDKLKIRHENLLLLLVPRHLERFDDVADMVASRGYKYARKSNGGLPSDIDVILGDTMGDMGVYYSMSDIAFVGGSLVDIGGHNTLEPASLGKVIFTGNCYRNFREITELLKSHNAIIIVKSAEDLYQNISKLLDNPDEIETLSQASKSAIKNSKGATLKCVKSIESMI